MLLWSCRTPSMAKRRKSRDGWSSQGIRMCEGVRESETQRQLTWLRTLSGQHSPNLLFRTLVRWMTDIHSICCQLISSRHPSCWESPLGLTDEQVKQLQRGDTETPNTESVCRPLERFGLGEDSLLTKISPKTLGHSVLSWWGILSLWLVASWYKKDVSY